MFDVGFWEFGLIGVLALVVLGPERLPGAARTAGRLLGKARRVVGDLKSDLKTELNQSEIDELRQLRDELKGTSQQFKDGVSQVGSATKDALMDDAITEAVSAESLQKPASSLVDDSTTDSQSMSTEEKSGEPSKGPGK